MTEAIGACEKVLLGKIRQKWSKSYPKEAPKNSSILQFNFRVNLTIRRMNPAFVSLCLIA